MRNFLLEQRKCSYKSVVETPDLGSDPTSDVFLQICVSFYFSQLQSWMRIQNYLYRATPLERDRFKCKLFIYDRVVSKI